MGVCTRFMQSGGSSAGPQDLGPNSCQHACNAILEVLPVDSLNRRSALRIV